MSSEGKGYLSLLANLIFGYRKSESRAIVPTGRLGTWSRGAVYPKLDKIGTDLFSNERSLGVSPRGTVARECDSYWTTCTFSKDIPNGKCELSENIADRLGVKCADVELGSVVIRVRNNVNGKTFDSVVSRIDKNALGVCLCDAGFEMLTGGKGGKCGRLFKTEVCLLV